MRRITPWLLALALLGCTSFDEANDTPTPPAERCVPGQQIDCACPASALRGAQSCLPDGSGYGECKCSDKAGGAAGAAGAAGKGGDTPFGGSGGNRAGAGAGGAGGAGQGGAGSGGASQAGASASGAGQGGAGQGGSGQGGSGPAGAGGAAGPGAGQGGAGQGGAGQGGQAQGGAGGAGQGGAGSAQAGAGGAAGPGGQGGTPGWFGVGGSCDECVNKLCAEASQQCLSQPGCFECVNEQGASSNCTTELSAFTLECAQAQCSGPCELAPNQGGAGGSGSGGSGAGGSGGATACDACLLEQCPDQWKICQSQESCYACYLKPSDICQTQGIYLELSACIENHCIDTCPGQGGAGGKAGQGGAGAGGAPSCSACSQAACPEQYSACTSDPACLACAVNPLANGCSSNAKFASLVQCTCTGNNECGATSGPCYSTCHPGNGGAGGSSAGQGGTGAAGSGGPVLCGDGVVSGDEVCDNATLINKGICGGNCATYCSGPDLYFNPETASCYKLIKNNTGWNNASETCKSQGPGFALATVASAGEMANLQGAFNLGDTGVWLNGRLKGASWEWQDGEPWSIPGAAGSWAFSEPGNSLDPCIWMSKGGIEDGYCTDLHWVLCERLTESCGEFVRVGGKPEQGMALVDTDGSGIQAPQSILCGP